jgi:hypothetical protein
MCCCGQALAAAMRRLQEEWWVLVVQLEHQHKTGRLNLSALQYYCQTPAASLALLASIAVRGGKGGWKGAALLACARVSLCACLLLLTPHGPLLLTLFHPCTNMTASPTLLKLSSATAAATATRLLLLLPAPTQGEVSARSDLTSAGVLNLLVSRQRSLAGDRGGQALVGQLLEAAAEPYFGILRQWMCSGVLDDPYGEFMVKVCVCVC